MELHEIRYFLALSQTLNFTKAAELSHVGQPALTRAIKKIEGELGGLLFSRERNNTHLSELGRMLVPHLTEVLTRTQAAKETARRFLRLDSAHLKLGVMRTLGPRRFVSFLGRFRADNPGIEIRLSEAVSDRLCDLLVKGELDVALIARPDGFAAPLQAEPLDRERFVIVCSTAHRFAHRTEVSVADLDGQPHLARINCEYDDMLRDICQSNACQLVSVFRGEREDWILTMVAAGTGICFLPEFSNMIPGVISRPVVAPSVEREVCLVTVAGRRWSPPETAFIRAVKQDPWPERS